MKERERERESQFSHLGVQISLPTPPQSHLHHLPSCRLPPAHHHHSVVERRQESCKHTQQTTAFAQDMLVGGLFQFQFASSSSTATAGGCAR